MGQVLGMCELICYHNCNLREVVDDVSLFPPCPPLCRPLSFSLRVDEVDEMNGQLVASFSLVQAENALSRPMTVHYVDVVKGFKVCLIHSLSKSHK